MPCNLHLYGTNTGRTFITTIANCQKQALLQKNCQKKKILSRALVGSDYHFIGTRCLSKSLELIVKPTQLCLFQIHFEIAFKRHWKRLGTGAPPSWEGVTPLNSANTATISSLSFSPSSGHTSYFVNKNVGRYFKNLVLWIKVSKKWLQFDDFLRFHLWFCYTFGVSADAIIVVQTHSRSSKKFCHHHIEHCMQFKDSFWFYKKYETADNMRCENESNRVIFGSDFKNWGAGKWR